jgi:hypothetical protein
VGNKNSAPEKRPYESLCSAETTWKRYAPYLFGHHDFSLIELVPTDGPAEEQLKPEKSANICSHGIEITVEISWGSGVRVTLMGFSIDAAFRSR